MKRIRCTYFDNNVDYKEMYESYIEFCEMNECEVQDDNSQDFFDYIDETIERDWSDFNENLKCSEYNTECVVYGAVGTWMGKREIMPKRFETLSEAVMACVSDCDYITIEQDCSKILVTACHHDGTNTFTINLLNDKGINTENGDLSKRCYHRTLKDYLF